MYAIIKTGGKQVKVEVGQAIYVEKLDVEAGEKVVFQQYLQQLHLQQLERLLLKNTANKRKSLLSNTNLKNIHTVNKVIVNHIQKWLSTRSTLNSV